MKVGVDTREEFQGLVRPHLDALFRTAFRMTGERSAAEDLVQEAFLRGFRAFSGFEKGSNFKAWMYRILTNTYISEYRRRKQAPRPTDFTEFDLEADPAVEPLKAEEVERVGDRLGDAARRALARLPEEHRLVFLLSSLEDLTYREIAEALQIPIGTVMSRLFRTRSALRTELAAHARALREGSAP
jgi:RNA polymerase sigma-70 factor (ECF subfamily)